MVTAEAEDEKPFSEESAEAKEEEEVSPAADVIAEEAGTTGATFTYQQLQAKSDKPVKGIDFKRREVNHFSQHYPLFFFEHKLSGILSLSNGSIRLTCLRKSSRLYLGWRKKHSTNCLGGSKIC